MIHRLLILCLLSVSFATHAQEWHELLPQENYVVEVKAPKLAKSVIESWINKDLYLAAGYQQSEYALKDIQGDIALLGFARTNIKRIQLMIKKDQAGLSELLRLQADGFQRYEKEYPQWDFNQLDVNPIDTTLTSERIESMAINVESKVLIKKKALGLDIGFELKSAPLKSRKVTTMLTQVIHEELYENGIEPKVGKEHNFSAEAYAYYKKEYPVLKTGMTKLFMALGNGLTFRFMVTGHERELSRLIEARPYDSVTLEEAFRLSYRLNNGDVYLTLLTLENLFAYHWTNPERDKVAVVQRLKGFTHYFNKGDKFGHWYHFWGMVLYGHVRGSVRSSVVGAIEELLSRLAGGEADQENQEGIINVRGGRIGGQLSKVIRFHNYRKGSFTPNEDYLEESYYLEPMALDKAIQKRFLPL
jgi:hypothetical protein